MSDVARWNVNSFGRAEKELRPRGEHSGHGRRDRPFQATTNPDLLWLGRAQQQTLDRLRSAVLAREGVLLLTGDVGTGKTILAKALLHRLRADAIIATVMYVGHDVLDFLKEIGDAWGGDGSPATSEAFYSRLPALLDAAAARDKRVVLFVDEAQSLSQNLLAEIGRLAAVAGEPRSQARLSILLVGQNELGTVLSRPENAALAERVGVRCTTVPLMDAEVGEYVAHQLKIARSTVPVFTEGGLRELAAASQGIPRLVNTIADLALLTSSQEGTPTIGAEVVRQCALGLGHTVSRPERPRSTRAKARARQRRMRQSTRRVTLYAVPLFVLLLVLAGYIYDSSRHGDSRPAPVTRAVSTAAPTHDRPAGNGVTGLEPARASDAASLAPLDSRTPDPVRPAVQHPRKHPMAAQPEPPPVTSLRQAVPPDANVAEARRESDATGTPTSRSQEIPTVLVAGPPGRSSDVRTGEDSEVVDPGEIIDWLLSEYPARRQ
jgi:type II secretory pathway predicted ATPase ExeA